MYGVLLLLVLLEVVVVFVELVVVVFVVCELVEVVVFVLLRLMLLHLPGKSVGWPFLMIKQYGLPVCVSNKVTPDGCASLPITKLVSERTPFLKPPRSATILLHKLPG